MHAPDQEIHFLLTETVQAYWDALLRELREFATIRPATATVPGEGYGMIQLDLHEGDLSRLDNAVMHCPVIEPKYREGRDGHYTVVVMFRRWWRASVPFLMDPDGDRDHYNYVVQEADQAPAPLDPDGS